MAGILSGPGVNEFFSFLVAEITISGVTLNESRSTMFIGTAEIEAPTSSSVEGQSAKTDEKCVANNSQAEAFVFALEWSRYTLEGMLGFFLFELTNFQNSLGLLRKLNWMRCTYER